MRMVTLLALLLLSCSCPQKASTRDSGAVTEPAPAPPQTPDEPIPTTPAPTKDRVAAVAESDALYARVEGTSFNNACKSDEECHVGGCSSEVCSAEAELTTTCEMPEAGWPQKDSSCGCVGNSCVWYRSGATAGEPAPPAGTAPGQGQPCPEGRCGEGFTCVKYYGVAGPSGPAFTSCEVPCPMPGDKCPEGQSCITIADGPGQVCRARP